MMLAQAIEAIALTAFTVVLAAAAFEDVRRHVIPNAVPIILCALWPLYFYFDDASSLTGALFAIGCAAAVFVAGAVLFFINSRIFGGGDVKLLAAAALWAGHTGTPKFLMITSIIGGVLALFLLIAAVARKRLGTLPAKGPDDVGHGGKIREMLKIPIPYGVAIAGAALIVVLSPQPG